ncbi:G-type lectin S-receptor-like serine/threonine-protein kinase At2g19130, partial [Papaver somniferum]|uniref:G-type lectin S-receptor-like serine/threonine-protein kinase At2g19130 n=1 Tax=Papaver somniferum TaxID=3469 RepID=UPI000E6F7D32
MSTYGLVQCTPDISTSDCERCLLLGVDKMFRLYPPGSDQGGDMTTIRPSCYMKVQFYPFYNITAANASSLSPPARPRKSTALWFSICTGVSLAAVIFIFAIICLCKLLVLRAKEKLNSKTRDGTLVAFTYRELQTVTKNFSQKLGSGGFGSVFKGVLPDSTSIAVRKLEGLRQGEKQFWSEVSTIGMIQHVNLVRLRGFCSEGVKRLLVYEFMPNGSLDSHLFNQKNTEVLDWKTRYQIALGTARGLTYLHEKCRDSIIHCDIKPENILLDAEFNPKIADFGLAKLVSRVLTTMRGTRGYLAPEWISGVAITPKADVYSHGKMSFEIISGKRNFEHFSNDEKISYIPAWTA